jgi:protein ImuB
MTLTEARALCGTVDVLAWDDAAIEAAITETTALLLQASPQVTPVAGAPGMWWIGAAGLATHGASQKQRERALAQMLASLARAWHPRARIAIADSCVAARAGTWTSTPRGDRVCIVPPGRDAAYLAAAPITLLPLEEEMRDALRALGIRTIGAFADLDAGDVEQRWGDAGLTAWRLAHGDDPRRPVLARPDAQPHVEMELATPADRMEPVLFLARPAIENLVSQVVSQGRAIASLAVTLTLDDARGALPTPDPAARGALGPRQPHTVTREIRMPRPLARPAPLFERCRGLLSQWTLTAPVSALRLTVRLMSPLTGEQGNLLDTSWRDPGAADAALERVRAELGPNVVVKPHVRDGYTPERSGTWREEEPGGGSREAGATAVTPGSPPPAPGPSALRLLETPERVDVDRDVEPRRILWRGRSIAVANAIGPERLSGDWWRDGYSRDYWRCESDADFGELVLYHDAAGWWLQGWYD